MPPTDPPPSPLVPAEPPIGRQGPPRTGPPAGPTDRTLGAGPPPTPGSTAMSPSDVAGGRSGRSPVWAVLAGVLIGLVSIGAGIAVGAATLPSTQDLQRATAEELGLDPDVLDHPLVAPVLDEVSRRVQDRVVDEARGSLVLAVVTAAGVAAAGVAVVALANRRRP